MPTFFTPSELDFQPKRKFRFLVSFDGFGYDTTYMVTKTSKPSFELGVSTEHRILNHTFKFPGIVKWNDIDLTLIDALKPNVGLKFYNALLNMGYVQPVSEDNLYSGITKSSANAALGAVRIKQLDGGSPGLQGKGDQDPSDVSFFSEVKYYGEWVLKNAFLKSVKWGDLDYSQDEIVTVDVGITYDYATYHATENGLAYGVGT